MWPRCGCCDFGKKIKRKRSRPENTEEAIQTNTPSSTTRGECGDNAQVVPSKFEVAPDLTQNEVIAFIPKQNAPVDEPEEEEIEEEAEEVDLHEDYPDDEEEISDDGFPYDRSADLPSPDHSDGEFSNEEFHNDGGFSMSRENFEGGEEYPFSDDETDEGTRLREGYVSAATEESRRQLRDRFYTHVFSQTR